ncbi:MAG: restriction endonuclease subunit S [Bacteroidales bacterium]|nr:restriction endonuclease subunit S [Bacteroidales bacterium]
MSNWISMELGQIASIFNGSTPSTNKEDYWNGDIIWITPKDLSDQNQKYILRGERTITQKALSNTKLLPEGTVLLSSRAPIGLLSIASIKLVTNQGFKNIVVNADILHNEFLYYYLKLKKNELNNLGSGTTFKELSKSTLEKYKIKFPDLSTQKSIAKVLSDLDSKIELNNRINRELEAMAKTLYDYWFVQFDFPVASSTSATENRTLSGVETTVAERSRSYKSSGGKMVFNAELKREIPEGWEVKKLAEIATTGSGGTPLSTKKEYYENGNIPWINSGEVNMPFIVSTKNFITQKGLENSSAKMFKRGIILMAMYGATAGKVSFMDIEACTNQAICAINPKEAFHRIYIKLVLEDLYKYLINLSSGSARDNLSQDKIRELKFVIPSESLIQKFDKMVNSSMKKILINLKQNQQLSELRDWLLPMLMNGQVVSTSSTSSDTSTTKLPMPELVEGMAAEPNVEYKKG